MVGQSPEAREEFSKGPRRFIGIALDDAILIQYPDCGMNLVDGLYVQVLGGICGSADAKRKPVA